MNILILNWRDPKNPLAGGAEVVTMQYAQAWQALGHNVTWFAAFYKGAKRQEIIEGVNIYRKGNFLSVYFFAPLFYLFSRVKYDLVVDELHGIPFFTPLYVKKSKFAFVHEVAGKIWDVMFPFPLNLVGRVIEHIMFVPYRKTPFVTVSESTAEELHMMGIQDVTMIENGVNTQKLPITIHKEKVPTFIFISRLVKMKGIEDVLDAFAHILKELPEAMLWVVGTGNKAYEEVLSRKVHALDLNNHVKFCGKVPEKAKYLLMKKAHVLLHASVKEGWGLVVIEAASQGTPAVTYDVGGLRDSVIHGKTGILTKSNSPEELAREAVSLVKDHKRYKEYQQNAKKWADSFTWERTREKSAAFIKTLI